MPLDLWQRNEESALAPAPAEGTHLPATFEQTYGPAWQKGLLYSQSSSAHNARLSVLDDSLSDIKRRTGQDLFGDLDPEYPSFDDLNAAIRERKTKDPRFDANEIGEDEITRRMVEKSNGALAEAAAMHNREKTAGGKFGEFLGGQAALITDPVNVLALPVAAPEGLGLLGAMAAWGAIGVGTAAVGEALSAPYKEQVTPGYLQTTEPLMNILETGLFTAGTAGLLKGAGNVWSRVRTGEWPRSVRDLGNVVDSENNVRTTNVLPGVEGEVAHREALTKTIDDIIAGRKVDVEPGTAGPFAAHEARIDVALGDAQAAAAGTLQARTERAAAATEAAPELPFTPTATEAQAEVHKGTVADGVQALAKISDYEMPRAEAEQIAQKIIDAKTDGDAGAILSEVATRPRTVAEFPPRPVREPEPVRALSPDQTMAMLGTPEHEAALRADIDRARAAGDIQVPAFDTNGKAILDAQGKPTFQSLDTAMKDVDDLKTVAEQIKACSIAPTETENG